MNEFTYDPQKNYLSLKHLAAAGALTVLGLGVASGTAAAEEKPATVTSTISVESATATSTIGTEPEAPEPNYYVTPLPTGSEPAQGTESTPAVGPESLPATGFSYGSALGLAALTMAAGATSLAIAGRKQ